MCMICGTCSAGCPITGTDGFDRRKIVRMILLGKDKELVDSKLPWLCTMCGKCEHACPMRLKPRSTKRHMFTCTQCMQCIEACENVQTNKYGQPVAGISGNNQEGLSLLKMLENQCALDASARDFGEKPDVPAECYSAANKGKKCCTR